MMYRTRTAIVALSGLSFVSLCLLQGPLSHASKLRAVSRESPKNPNSTKLAYQMQGGVRDVLPGEWRVKCGVRMFQNGELLRSSEDESLVVAETDSDGSYRLYKFPIGFGEGFPRLRRVSATQYTGQDTVRGITTLVNQNVDLEPHRITIRQTVIDTSSRQPQTDIICTGTRLLSTVRFPASSSGAEVCQPGPAYGHLSDRKLLRRYESVRPFADGLAAVAVVPRGARSRKWGFIDETGRIVIPPVYDVVTSFQGGLAGVGKSYGRGRNLKYGVVEKLGPQVTPNVNYDAVKILGEGFAAVGYTVSGSPGLRWNLINRENTTIFHGFDDIGCFLDGRARASYTDGNVVRTGYVNKVGDFFASEK